MGVCCSSREGAKATFEKRTFGGNLKSVRDDCLYLENGRQLHGRGTWVSHNRFAAPWGQTDTWVASFASDGAWTTTVPVPFADDARMRAAVLASSPGCLEEYVDQKTADKKVLCPSVHVWWQCAEVAEPSGYAVEVEPVRSSDATYFMAVGFHCGYMGIQDRNPKWVLFSVWNGDSPAEHVGEAGCGVTVRPFGGEGDGLQAFKAYEWDVGRRYRCIVTAEASGESTTDFTGWIQDVSAGTTERLATLRRRHATENGRLRGVYSFLEDWAGTGVCREGKWGPAFACCDGAWVQATSVKGSTTDTSAQNVRIESANVTDAVGGRVSMQSGGDAVPDPGFKGPFVLSTSSPPTAALGEAIVLPSLASESVI